MADPKTTARSRSLNTPPVGDAPQGDFAGPGDELLLDGQEEVFSRAEVESGRIEHLSQAGSGGDRDIDPAAPSAASAADRSRD